MDDVSRQPTERFGRAVQLRRVELGLKRRELAERADLSYPYISEIENGMKDPSAKALRRIAEALELQSPTELIALADRLGGTGGDAGSILVDQRPPEPGLVPTAQPAYSFVTPATARPSGGGAPVEHAQSFDRLQEMVAAIVRAELGAWARTELPVLVEREVARILEAREP